MSRAAIIGLGIWGQHLVRAVQATDIEPGPYIRFAAAATGTPDKVRGLAQEWGQHVLTEMPMGLCSAEMLERITRERPGALVRRRGTSARTRCPSPATWGCSNCSCRLRAQPLARARRASRMGGRAGAARGRVLGSRDGLHRQGAVARPGRRRDVPRRGLLNNGIMRFDPEPGKPLARAGQALPGQLRPRDREAADGRRFALVASGGRKILGAVLQLSCFLMDHGMDLEEAFHQGRIEASGHGTVTVDASLPVEVRQALVQHLPVATMRRLVYPYAFACPAGVLRAGTLNEGCTEVISPWGDAVSG